MKAGTLTAISAAIPGCEVDDTPLPHQDRGRLPRSEVDRLERRRPKPARQFPLRPLVLTHAGDGSNRVFVAIQQGTIHVFPNDPKADKTKVFLDIRSGSATATRKTSRASWAGVPSAVQEERRVLRLLHEEEGQDDQRDLALQRQQGRSR